MFTNNNNPSTCWINEFSYKATVQCGIVYNNDKPSSTYLQHHDDDNNNMQCKDNETSLNLDIIDFIQSWELLKMMTYPKRQSSTQNSISQHYVIKQEEELVFHNQCINNNHDDDQHDEYSTLQQFSTYNAVIPSPTITSHQQMTFNTSSPLNTFQNNRVNTISNDDSSLDKAAISNLETYQFPIIKNPYIDQNLPTTTVTNSNTFVTNTTANTTDSSHYTTTLKVVDHQIRKRKVSNNCNNKSEKRKTSISSSTTTTSITCLSNLSSIGNNSCCTSSTHINYNNCNNNILQSNPKHLKRRRKYKKRKGSSINSNPAQSQMEFHFPIWTFHME